MCERLRSPDSEPASDRSFNTCARQVRAAIDDILLGGYEMSHSWAEASERHQLMYTDRPTRLQY